MLLLLLAACDGPQSTLSPAGRDAERIAALFWWMAGGSLVIWALVIGLAVHAMMARPAPLEDRRARLLIIGGGVALPTAVLTALLVYGLSMMPALLAPGPPGGVRVHVTGEQWWWRVVYTLPDGRAVELANEVRLPVGRRTPFLLESPDVIHSFWVPSIAGKVDMIPGRVNVAALEPTRVGTFRGVCAEYCGASHALMSFYAIVLEPDGFEAWLEHQLEPAAEPDGPVAAQGRDVFLASGCGACHTVRGIDAHGEIGPDLTHVGGRVSLGAGVLGNDVAAFERWIGQTADLKPDVHMPAFGMLPDDDLFALSIYLDGLE